MTNSTKHINGFNINDVEYIYLDNWYQFRETTLAVHDQTTPCTADTFIQVLKFLTAKNKEYVTVGELPKGPIILTSKPELAMKFIDINEDKISKSDVLENFMSIEEGITWRVYQDAEKYQFLYIEDYTIEEILAEASIYL